MSHATRRHGESLERRGLFTCRTKQLKCAAMQPDNIPSRYCEAKFGGVLRSYVIRNKAYVEDCQLGASQYSF